MLYADKIYQDFLRHILTHGATKSDRTGTGTTSIFGYRMEFDVSNGQIPLLTTKQMHVKSIIRELLWFISGSTDNNVLNEHGVTIWDEWAKEDGSLGKIYGYQWRKQDSFKLVPAKQTESLNALERKGYTTAAVDSDFDVVVMHKHIDQLQEAIDTIRNNPDSRRIIVNAWNASDLDEMQLPPCHALFQFYVNNGKLDLQLYQRSADAFLGVPFNISQYCVLLHMVARVTGLKPGKFIWTGGDCHIYSDHHVQVQTQLERTGYESPTLRIADRGQKELDDFVFEDFTIENYNCHPRISAPVAK